MSGKYRVQIASSKIYPKSIRCISNKTTRKFKGENQIQVKKESHPGKISIFQEAQKNGVEIVN